MAKMAKEVPSEGNGDGNGQVPKVPEELKNNVYVGPISTLIKPVDWVYNWGRAYSVWPLFFGLACCAFEMIATMASRYDPARFGCEIMRASPRQADMLMITGTVTKKMVPQIVRLYNQMAEPKYVLCMGACACGGGPFKEGYNVVSGIDKYLPVDVYIPGCPPKPESLVQGIMKIQEMIRSQSVVSVPWYPFGKSTERDEGIPIPILGPDIIDTRQIPQIKEEIARRREARDSKEAGEKSPPEPGYEPIRLSLEGSVRSLISPHALPEWDTTPTPADLEMADRINGALSAEAATAEKNCLVIKPEHLTRVGEYLRDTPGLAYNLLSNVTGVDYPGRDPRFEVVYHLYSLKRGGGPLTLKTRVPEERPEVPSLTGVWRSADLQEREVWDLYGIRFPGHPNLKRILMWEGFYGHPMRKDYHEAYYEEPVKPFRSRWPEGGYFRAEDKNPFGRNVVYPDDWDPDEWREQPEHLIIKDAWEAKDLREGPFHTDRMVVNFGPHHPSTHGVFRMVLTLDGETVVNLEPMLGYLHRNHEKIGERNTWTMNIPYLDRLDYVNTMSNQFPYIMAVERMLGLEVPERAEYIRVIMAELNRVISHMMLVAFMTNDMGAYFTPSLWAFEERERVLDLFERVGGSRLMTNYFRFGGVSRDVTPEWIELARELVRERLPWGLDELEKLLSQNEILLARTKGVGVVSPELAVNCGVTGPMLRAVGVDYDIRKVEPYSVYDRFDFDVPLLHNGDVYDRYLIRILEARESLKILEQAFDGLPGGPIRSVETPWQVQVPAGEIYARSEMPKGELGFYLVSNGGANAWRYRVRSPSYINLNALPDMCKGHKVADTVIIFGAVDIVLGEVDR